MQRSLKKWPQLSRKRASEIHVPQTTSHQTRCTNSCNVMIPNNSVDVIIPGRGSTLWLEPSLTSIALQSFQPGAIIVIDDGLAYVSSTEDLGKKLFGRRFRLIRNAGPRHFSSAQYRDSTKRRALDCADKCRRYLSAQSFPEAAGVLISQFQDLSAVAAR